MQRWEYAELLWGLAATGGTDESGAGAGSGGSPVRGTVWFTHGAPAEEIDDLPAGLHRLGQAGWELVAVTTSAWGAIVTRHYAFKRPLP
ncbi:MAG: hypothetical protein ACRDJN_32200 [Chloroflexota bacterium]